MKTLKVKRIYLPAAKHDGFRVLVDRLWPRGLSKKKAVLDHWAREVAPSTTLRKWFGHDPKRWPEFKRRYAAELRANRPAVKERRAILKAHATVTLLFGAHDKEHNQAVVLATHLRRGSRL